MISLPYTCYATREEQIYKSDRVDFVSRAKNYVGVDRGDFNARYEILRARS